MPGRRGCVVAGKWSRGGRADGKEAGEEGQILNPGEARSAVTPLPPRRIRCPAPLQPGWPDVPSRQSGHEGLRGRRQCGAMVRATCSVGTQTWGHRAVWPWRDLSTSLCLFPHLLNRKNNNIGYNKQWIL